VGENRERIDRFLEALEREIDGWTSLAGRRVESVFFGGGTPSLVEPARIGDLLRRLGERFDVASDAEVTAEANPSDLDPERLDGLRAAGVNRLSIGAQSFVDRELGLLGRRHDAARIGEVVGRARAAGFENLSLDLMVGIPAQTDGSFASSLERVVELAPEHVSLYLLEVHAGSEMDALRRDRPRLFAGEEAQRRRYLGMVERLERAGLCHYEISNFARPGRECRHNLRYWRGLPWLGLGPAAHSYVDGRRFRHLPDLEGWRRDPMAVEELPVAPELERLMTGLRLVEGVEIGWFDALGVDAPELARRLARVGPLVERAGDRLRLTTEGFLVSNAVLGELLG